MSDRYTIPTSRNEIRELILDKVVEPFKKRGLKMFFIAGYSTMLDDRFVFMNHLYTYDDYNGTAISLEDLVENLLEKCSKDHGKDAAKDWGDTFIRNIQRYLDIHFPGEKK